MAKPRFNLWFDQISYDIDKDHKYELFLIDLYNVPFEVVLERDINRVNDVIDARNEFYGGEISTKNEASVLEILYILSKRMQFLISFSLEIDKIFWKFIENLGLEYDFDDKYWLKRDYFLSKNGEKLRIWMKRCFKSDGKCSIFPLNCAKKDQRGVELWYQMQAYVAENYPI